ncbi:ABC transporter ATP-binding protein, partial [bacterium]
MAGIQVKNIVKYYGKFEALSDVSFDVADGEILGLLGPNGAGKTTTMRILTTFIPPSSGTATVNGFDIIKQSMRVRESIGYMPENPPLYEDMRVGKFLKFVANLKKVLSKKIPQRLEYV